MEAAVFKSRSLRIFVEIDMTYIHEIERGILKYMEKLLLKHSTKIGGIPITYSVSQISNRGTIIHDNPNVFITADMDVLVLEIPIGCRCAAKDGLVFGAFYSMVDGDGCFNGELVVQGFSACKSGSTRINGSKPPENTDLETSYSITLQFPMK